MPVDPAVLAALRAALDADPSSTEVRAHLAALLLESGDTDGAWEQARVVLATQPDHLGALDVAAAAGEALGESDAAAAYRRLRDALSPGEPAPEPDLPPPPPAQPMRVTASMPDTADELLEQWAEAEPLPEPDVGTLASPSITLADVGGLDAVKERLELSFLAPLRHPELRLQFGKSMRGGLVLWGPPGCGKTYIAKAVAGELGANFYEVGLADVLDMWIGSSERNLRSVFEVARRNRPCVLFFDEVDALGHKRTQLRVSGGAMRGVVNQFLTELDGATNDNEGVFVLAATNHPWDIDPALLRPGRFDRKLLVGPPDQPARAAILATHLRGRPPGRSTSGRWRRRPTATPVPTWPWSASRRPKRRWRPRSAPARSSGSASRTCRPPCGRCGRAPGPGSTPLGTSRSTATRAASTTSCSRTSRASAVRERARRRAGARAHRGRAGAAGRRGAARRGRARPGLDARLLRARPSGDPGQGLARSPTGPPAWRWPGARSPSGRCA